jgi:hypothetical protein
MKAAFVAIILLWTTSSPRGDASPGSTTQIGTRVTQPSHTLVAANRSRQETEEAPLKDKNVVEIINSGSTNTAGFQIKIERSGKAAWSLTGRLTGRRYLDPASRAGEQQLSNEMAKQLFDDVESAMPFTQYPNDGCAKSRSFGYTISIRYLGEWSPDLTCQMTEPKLIRLKDDMQEVVKTLHVGCQLPRQPSD